jgi:hypothetical protein
MLVRLDPEAGKRGAHEFRDTLGERHGDSFLKVVDRVKWDWT